MRILCRCCSITDCQRRSSAITRTRCVTPSPGLVILKITDDHIIISSYCEIPASCDYWRWGSGGRQENINAICVLGLNMINDKVFLILWWWFLFLAIVGALRIVYRIVQAL